MRIDKESRPLALKDTLRDLAVLRAADIDLAAILRTSSATADPRSSINGEATGSEQSSLDRSFEFVREARAAIQIINKGLVDEEGERIERVRGGLEDVLKGLRPGAS